MIICDIDHFKQVNDRHGHDVGDQVIRKVAELLAGVARESDVLGRWGGEEFLAFLPDTDEGAAFLVAERMRRVVEGATIAVGEGLRVTISLGVAGLVPGVGPGALAGGARPDDACKAKAAAATAPRRPPQALSFSITRASCPARRPQPATTGRCRDAGGPPLARSSCAGC